MLRTSVKVASTSSELVGATGRRYFFKELIQERPHLGRVWLATSGHDKFVLKDIPKDIFSGFNESIRPRLRENPYIRLPSDTIPGQSIFVYRYLTDDFLSLVRKQIPMQAKKQILKASLRGIVELHDRDIAHLDIKPDNIMVNLKMRPTSLKVGALKGCWLAMTIGAVQRRISRASSTNRLTYSLLESW